MQKNIKPFCVQAEALKENCNTDVVVIYSASHTRVAKSGRESLVHDLTTFATEGAASNFMGEGAVEKRPETGKKVLSLMKAYMKGKCTFLIYIVMHTVTLWCVIYWGVFSKDEVSEDIQKLHRKHAQDFLENVFRNKPQVGLLGKLIILHADLCYPTQSSELNAYVYVHYLVVAAGQRFSWKADVDKIKNQKFRMK